MCSNYKKGKTSKNRKNINCCCCCFRKVQAKQKHLKNDFNCRLLEFFDQSEK